MSVCSVTVAATVLSHGAWVPLPRVVETGALLALGAVLRLSTWGDVPVLRC